MKIAVCCAMNNNRSMEAHKILLESNVKVDSYGTSPQIKIPGETIDTPNIYQFGITYFEIYNDLFVKNEKFYERIGILKMLERNMKIKESPESYFLKQKNYDLVITAEEKCFVSIYDYHRSIRGDNKLYLVNFDIKDTINDASSGALEIKDFVKYCIINKDPYEYRIANALEKIHVKYGKNNLFTVMDCN